MMGEGFRSQVAAQDGDDKGVDVICQKPAVAENSQFSRFCSDRGLVQTLL